MTNFDQWDGFDGRLWKEEVNTRDHIHQEERQCGYCPDCYNCKRYSLYNVL